MSHLFYTEYPHSLDIRAVGLLTTVSWNHLRFMTQLLQKF
ncbi:hypothetical protein ATG66_0452 [Vibrio sp. ES.051]|nr:hypothetical protein ATG66_0452 [Vibrio sp. ES.051]